MSLGPLIFKILRTIYHIVQYKCNPKIKHFRKPNPVLPNLYWFFLFKRDVSFILANPRADLRL